MLVVFRRLDAWGSTVAAVVGRSGAFIRSLIFGVYSLAGALIGGSGFGLRVFSSAGLRLVLEGMKID